MKANRTALKVAMARRCMVTGDLVRSTDLSPATIAKAIAGKSVSTATIGKIARALGVDPAEIIETEEE